MTKSRRRDKVLNISGTELRDRLNEGRDIPAMVHLSGSRA